MPIRTCVLILALTLVLPACGGGGGGGGDAVPEPVLVLVDAANGDDTNPGTETAPVKTITRALQLAASGGTVVVLPGLYMSGETFPLVVPPQVALYGDIPNKGATTQVVGAGPHPQDPSVWATLLVGNESGVGGLSLKNPIPAPPGTRGYAAYLDTTGQSLVQDCTFDGTVGTAIGLAGLGGIRHVNGNRIRNNPSGVGIHAAAGIYGATLEENEITGNWMGLHIEGGGIDLGGGDEGSDGGNAIANNLHTDLFLEPGIIVSATSNRWNSAPPLTLINGGGGGGVDIYNPGGLGSVDTTGAVVYVP